MGQTASKIDGFVGSDPAPEMTRLESAAVLIGSAGLTAWSNCLIGGAPPAIAAYYRRASEPQIGDLVVESSSFFLRCSRNDRPFTCVGTLVKHELEALPFAADPDNPEQDQGTYTEDAWYIDILSAPEGTEPFRWVNASFVSIPRTIAERFEWTLAPRSLRDKFDNPTQE